MPVMLPRLQSWTSFKVEREVQPKSHTNGSEHALVHGNAAGLESHWPWKGRCRHGMSSPILTSLETSRLWGTAGNGGPLGVSSSIYPPHHCLPGIGKVEIGSGFYFCRVYVRQPLGIDPLLLSLGPFQMPGRQQVCPAASISHLPCGASPPQPWMGYCISEGLSHFRNCERLYHLQKREDPKGVLKKHLHSCTHKKLPIPWPVP